MTQDAFRSLAGTLGPFLLACVAGCASSPLSSTDESKIKGTVTYRERIALPSDAVIEVSLLDTSIQDAAANHIASTTVRPEGRQVPISFELPYDGKMIQLNRMYAVRASIRSGDKTMFTTNTVYPVITKGNPKSADLVLVSVSGQTESEGGGLVGSSWRLENFQGGAVLTPNQATITFPEGGMVTGNASCNRFFGTFEIRGETIKFGPLGSTKMACSEIIMSQETKYLKALHDAERFVVEGNSLLIYSTGVAVPMRFSRTSP